jgi:hypothetical protein
MAWNLTAEFIETCSCNMLCPCWYGVRELMVMDQGWCDSANLAKTSFPPVRKYPTVFPSRGPL